MSFSVRFPAGSPLFARGRNNVMRSSGIDITAWAHCVELRSITSRGDVSDSAILALPATREAADELHRLMVAAIEQNARNMLINKAVVATSEAMASDHASGAALAAMALAAEGSLSDDDLIVLRGLLQNTGGNGRMLCNLLRDHSNAALNALIASLTQPTTQTQAA